MAAVAGQVEYPERPATQEVSYNSEGAKICGYLARPRESGRHPGVINFARYFWGQRSRTRRSAAFRQRRIHHAGTRLLRTDRAWH